MSRCSPEAARSRQRDCERRRAWCCRRLVGSPVYVVQGVLHISFAVAWLIFFFVCLHPVPFFHAQAQNLSVVLPRDTHSLALGASAFRMCKDCQGFRGMLSEQGQHLENEFLAEDPWLQRQPIVKWDAAWGKCTLLMLDPDAPQPRSQLGAAETGALGPWLHWLVVDAVGAPENGDTLVEHMGPSPPKGRHRYIFLLFRQGGCEVKVTSRERSKWDFAGFLRENKGLELVAANHYTATV